LKRLKSGPGEVAFEVFEVVEGVGDLEGFEDLEGFGDLEGVRDFRTFELAPV